MSFPGLCFETLITRYRRTSAQKRRAAATFARGSFLLAIASAACAMSAQTPVAFPGSTAVGSASSSVDVEITLAATGVAALPVAVTQGASNGEFTLASPGTCTGTLTANATCTVKLLFNPKFPGLRTGSVLVPSNSGAILGRASVAAVATGSLAVISPGRIDTVAGDGDWIYRQDGVPATSAPIFLPTGITEDAAGNLFLSDSNNNRIRRVDAASGLISTIAGNGSPGFSGDNGPATSAMISSPAGLTLDGAGNVFFVDSGNHAVRRIDALTGFITTVAGIGGVQGYSGDHGPATAAKLSLPEAVAFDAAGNLYIADTGNHAIRKISAITGLITTIAGGLAPGYNGDNIAATSAALNSPWGVAVALDGTLYIADLDNNRVRRIDANTGIITTVAGNGTRGFGGDGSSATTAQLNAPAALTLDPAGNLYIADSGNNRVRELAAATGNIATLTGGSSEQFLGDGGSDALATFYGPYALHFDASGNLLIADMFHNRVRRVRASALPLQYDTIRVSKTSPPQAVALSNDGNAPLHPAPDTFVNSALDPVTTTCSTQSPLASAATCNLGVEFAPTVVGESVTGTLTVNSDAAATPPMITLTGTVLTVNPTTVTVSSSLNPSLLGGAVTFTASISSSDATLGGTLDFLDGTTVLCHAVPVTSKSGTCTTASLTLGQHSITASYTGDSDNASGVSPALLQVVKQTATLTLSTTPNPATVTVPISLSVTATAATGTPSGTVTFYDGAIALGSSSLNAQGVAVYSTTTLTAATHNLSAKYAGDATNAPGQSNSVSQVINLGNTLTMLSSSNASTPVGSPVTFTASVNSTSSLAVTGSVQFTDGPTTLGSATLTAGSASLTLSTLAPGAHSIVATYQGDNDNAVSHSTALAQTIQQLATTTALVADVNPASAGAPVQLTATVALAAGATADGPLTGQVTFSDGAITLGTATMDPNGVAVLLTRTLSVGAHNLIATYNGITNYAVSHSAALTETINSTTTATGLSAGSSSALAGKPVTLTAVVTSPTGTPTGSVTFLDGAINIGQATLNGAGTAVLTISTLSVGNHNLTASYGGDASYNTSTSTSLPQLISLGTPALALSGPSAPVNAGTPAAFTVNFTTNGVAPTGTLTLLDGTTVLGAQTLSATGTFPFTANNLAIGTHTITASYSGDPENAPAASTILTVIVQQAATTTSLVSSVNPVTLGQALTLTAAVTSASPGLTGSISFLDGTNVLGSAALNANGSATLNTTSLTAGPHTLTAVYSGDTNHSTSTSPALIQHVVQTAQIGLTSSLNPAVAGASVTFSVKVAGTGSLMPTGSVSLLDGQSLLGVLALDANGSASLSTSTLTVGSHNLSVVYPGDTNYAAVTSAILVQTISSDSTQVTLTASANPATFGAPLTLQAAVKTNGETATGSIVFTEGGVTLGSSLLNGGGAASLTLSTLTPGTHTIVANYAGDSNAAASVSSPLTVVVRQAAAVALASSANPASTLTPITLTASVTNSGQSIATGELAFTDGGTQLGVVTLDANGNASLTLPQLSSGTHNIMATYSGDPVDFAATSATLSQVIQLRPTTTALTASTDPNNNQQLTLIAVVRWTGATTPTGNVTFTNGSATLGSVPVDATGVATLTINVGSNTENIVATYAGDASYATSSSSSTSIGAGPSTQFIMTINPGAVSVESKQHSTVTLSLASQKSFSDTMSFGCLGLPYAATCTFSATQTALASNGTATVQLTIDTGNPLGAGGQASNTHAPSSTTMLCFLPGIALAGFGLWKARKRTRLTALLLLLLGCGMVASMTGCGGLQVNGTPAGTYKFQVTALGQKTGVSESQTMTLTVTQ